MAQMRRFTIERAIPGPGSFSMTDLCGAARASNQALETIGPSVQWQHGCVAMDKMFRVYLAKSKDAIRRHSEPSGIPVAAITEIPQIIAPLTANN